MRQALNGLHINGSFLVIKNDKTWMNYATENEPDTSYLINSAQKIMTATMIMREVQDHKLSLNTKLSRFYPDIPGSKQIKISNLMTMTSGLYLKKKQHLGRKVFLTPEDNVKTDIKKTIFKKEKLGKWHYASLNYIYLSGILSKLEDKNYEDIFNDTFTKPLQLKHTAFIWESPDALQASNWVPGHSYKNRKYHVYGLPREAREAHVLVGAGSVVMSNQDLAKTLHAILSGDLLTEKSRSVMFKGKAPSYYNGGIYNGDGVKKANGAGEGYYTFLRSDNKGRNIIIVQTNKTGAGFLRIRDQMDEIFKMLKK